MRDGDPGPGGSVLNARLGAGAEARKPTLATLRQGDMVALCDLLPEGVHWGDPLTPEVLRALLPTEGDHACRFAVWWAHKRKTFTTARQAAWSAWIEARGMTPNVRITGLRRTE